MVGIEGDYVFIESHPDDLLLSAGGLFLQKKPRMVITVFSGKNIDNGTKELCKDYGIGYVFLNVPDIDYNEKIDRTTPEHANLLVDIIKKANLNVITTMGAGHPAHEWVANIIKDNFKDTIFVRDFPHSYKKRKVNFQEYVNKNKFKLSFILECDFDKKVELFKYYYKSQKSLLFFEKRFFKIKPREEYYTVKK